MEKLVNVEKNDIEKLGTNKASGDTNGVAPHSPSSPPIQNGITSNSDSDIDSNANVKTKVATSGKPPGLKTVTVAIDSLEGEGYIEGDGKVGEGLPQRVRSRRRQPKGNKELDAPQPLNGELSSHSGLS